MTFVAEDESDLALMEDFGVKTKRFVRNDEDRIGRATAESVHESVKISIDLGLRARVDG